MGITTESTELPQALFDAIRAVIGSILLNEYVITPESHLVNDLKMDSIYMMEFVIALEEQYHFKMTEEQLDRLWTVGDAVALIMEISGNVSQQ